MRATFVQHLRVINNISRVLLQGLGPPAAATATAPDSQSSYKEYPVHRPLVHTLMRHAPETRTHPFGRSSSPSKAIPETSSEGDFKFCATLPVGCRRAPWLHAQPDATHVQRVSAVFSFFHMAVSNFTRCFADIVPSLLSRCCPCPLTRCARAPAAIHSALRNLQMKIRRLELEKRQAELTMRYAARRDVSHAHPQSHKVTQTPPGDPTGVERETGGQPSCNQGGSRPQEALPR